MRKGILIAFLLVFITAASLGVNEVPVNIESFNSGELSPLMNARYSYPKYKSGARTLQNMLVRSQGPISRRPGTRYIASVKDATKTPRIISFEYSTTDSYIIEIGDYYARFYRTVDGVAGQITTTYSAWTTTTGYVYGSLVTNSGSYYRCAETHTAGTFATDLAAGKWVETSATDLAYEIATPWASTDVFALQFVQDDQFMRIVHPDYEPYKLTRTGHTAWTCTAIDSTTGPFMAENVDKGFTITPSSTGQFASYDYYKYNDDKGSSVRGTEWRAQTFQAAASYTITGVKIKLWRVGWPGTVTVSIRATSGGLPTGADIVSGTTDGNTLTTTQTGKWREVIFSSTTGLTSGTTYAVVVRSIYGTAYNTILWRYDGSSPSYTGGSYIRSGNSGSSWTASTGSDFMFETVESGETNSLITTLTSSAPLFDDPNHVGALFQISHSLANESISHQFWSYGDSNSTSITVQKYRRYDVLTSGLWKGKFKIQRSYDEETTWEDVYSVEYDWNGNIQYHGQELEETCLYRMAMRDMYITTHNVRNNEGFCQANFNALGFINNGVVEITSVTDANTAIGEVKIALGSTDATWRWAEGAWSDYRGWPRTIEHHEQRVVYGGSASFPQTIWASIIAEEDGDYEDFTSNVDSDATGNLGGPDHVAWTYILPGMNPIQWLDSGEYLFVGTSAGVGRLGQPDKPITPNYEPIFRIQNHNGCAYMQPAKAVDAILYVERGSQKVHELAYAYATDKYMAPDMTILAEHITGDSIDEMVFQNRPEPVLWCIRNDGQLLSFTYRKSHEVLAWSRSTTEASGQFKSAATMPGSAEDELWAVVDRTINSLPVAYIERFEALDWGTDQNDCWFVDAAGTDGNDLSWLESEEVAVFADGRPIGNFTVSLGAITASGYANYIIGLPYTSIYESMPIVAGTGGVSSALMKTSILSMNIDFYETLACNLGYDADKTSAIEFSDDSFETTVDAFTGIKPMTFPRGISRDTTIYIDVNSPVPMTIRAINPKLRIYD